MTFFSLCHDDLFPCTCTPVFSFSSYKETRPFGLGTPTIGLSFYLITYLRTLSPNMVKFCYTRGWDLNVWIFVVVQLLSCVWPICNPMCCGPPGFSAHGIFQARILAWFAISFSRGFSRPRDQTRVSCVSCFGRWIHYHWGTREAIWILG